MITAAPGTPDAVAELLRDGRYVCDQQLATAVFLAMRLERPLLLEGEAGVGKTELARVLAERLGRRLIRLQCYEGLDLASACYEWDHPRQLLAIRLAEASGPVAGDLSDSIYSERFLVRRPLLQALSPDPGGAPVLLIDELDRADEPFEAFLLELLSDFQITIPELGTIRAPSPPIVVLTSNRTREIHDALRRRCLYHWIDYPTAARELEILQARVPEARRELTEQIVTFVQELRDRDLFKPPGIAESIDWARALLALDATALDGTTIDRTLGVLLKYRDDLDRVRGTGA